MTTGVNNRVSSHVKTSEMKNTASVFLLPQLFGFFALNDYITVCLGCMDGRLMVSKVQRNQSDFMLIRTITGRQKFKSSEIT